MKVIPSIDWSVPGENRYRGPIDKAIMSYTDIPLDVRQRLVSRAAARQYDEIAVLGRNGIHGAEHSYVNLRQMFFGTHHRAEKVTTEAWPFDQIERGLIYTEADSQGNLHTVIIPLVCGNVARVDRTSLIAALPKDQINIPHSLPALPVRQVPEPSSGLLILAALTALVIFRRRGGRR